MTPEFRLVKATAGEGKHLYSGLVYENVDNDYVKEIFHVKLQFRCYKVIDTNLDGTPLVTRGDDRWEDVEMIDETGD